MKTFKQISEACWKGYKQVGMKKKGKKMVPNCVPEEYIAEAAKAPRWKRAGPNGELEIKFPTGRRFKVEKQLDHNERHRGEWKVMEWQNGEWEWADTYSPKGYAKEMAMKLGQYKNGKKVADYSHTFQYESYMYEEIKPHPEVIKAYKKTLDAEDKAGDYNHRSNKARVTRAANHLSKKIKQHHGELNMRDKIKLRTALQNIAEAAGYWGTSELADKYARETPGQEPMKTHKNVYKEPKANKIKDVK